MKTTPKKKHEHSFVAVCVEKKTSLQVESMRYVIVCTTCGENKLLN